MSTTLLDKRQIAKQLDPTGERITPYTIVSWYRARKIPGIKLGHRTLLFDESAVREAVQKFTVREVA